MVRLASDGLARDLIYDVVLLSWASLWNLEFGLFNTNWSNLKLSDSLWYPTPVSSELKNWTSICLAVSLSIQFSSVQFSSIQYSTAKALAFKQTWTKSNDDYKINTYISQKKYSIIYIYSNSEWHTSQVHTEHFHIVFLQLTQFHNFCFGNN